MKSDNSHMLSLVAENLSIILTYAHSRASFDELRGRAVGEWRSLTRLLYEIPELRADRALLEMAYLFRAIDDAEGVSQYIPGPLGSLQKKSGDVADLSFRDMTNKIIHATSHQWCLGDPNDLSVVCIGGDSEQWVSATISIEALAFTAGMFGL